jgi:hypothetical protein
MCTGLIQLRIGCKPSPLNWRSLLQRMYGLNIKSGPHEHVSSDTPWSTDIRLRQIHSSVHINNTYIRINQFYIISRGIKFRGQHGAISQNNDRCEKLNPIHFNIIPLHESSFSVMTFHEIPVPHFSCDTCFSHLCSCLFRHNGTNST